MLVSIIVNLVQSGGVIPPPTPTPQGGGGETDFGLQSRMKAEDELALRRKKILDLDDEDWILFIHNFIISQNLN